MQHVARVCQRQLILVFTGDTSVNLQKSSNKDATTCQTRRYTLSYIHEGRSNSSYRVTRIITRYVHHILSTFNIVSCSHKCSAVAEMGDCLAAIDMGRKLGAGSPSNTMWPGLMPISLPSGILIQPAVWPHQTWAEKWRAMPLWGGGAGSPSNTIWPGPRPISTPCFILIHPTVWPQYTNVTDRQERTDWMSQLE